MGSRTQAPGYDDERAIRRCLHRYCRGIDRCDTALVASAYHSDATDDHGAFKGLGIDFAGYATEALRRDTESTHHMIGDPDIEFMSATLAHVETYVSAVHRCRDEQGPCLERFGGRYVDRFEKRDGQWLIAHRICIHEWNAKERVELAWQYDRFTEGRRDRTDPSYPA